MSEESNRNPTMSFWIIGVVALMWNLIGLYMYYVQVSSSPQQLAAQLTPEQVAAIMATPAWATSASATAVTAGVIASLLLLLRNGLAAPLFVVSFLAVLVQDVYIFGISDIPAAFGAQPALIQVTVFVIAVFLVWYSMQQRNRGVIT